MGTNPEVEDAADFAVEQLSQQSNSLYPFTLKKVPRRLCAWSYRLHMCSAWFYIAAAQFCMGQIVCSMHI
jgi:hypothetical protein